MILLQLKITKFFLNIVKLKIDFSSTPFDLNSVDELSPYLKFFKISSSDITNFPLLKK